MLGWSCWLVKILWSYLVPDYYKSCPLIFLKLLMFSYNFLIDSHFGVKDCTLTIAHMPYSWLFTQGILLAGLKNHLWYKGWESSWPRAKKVSSLLYCLSTPRGIIFDWLQPKDSSWAGLWCGSVAQQMCEAYAYPLHQKSYQIKQKCPAEITISQIWSTMLSSSMEDKGHIISVLYNLLMLLLLSFQIQCLLLNYVTIC